MKIEKLSVNDILNVLKLENELIGKTSYESIEKTLTSDSLHYYVMKEDCGVIGFFEFSCVSPEAELYDIAIAKNFQGRGLGKILFEYFVNLCREMDCRTIFLEVNKINQKAINLYKSFGFYEYSKRENYYGKNDAVLMKLDLI